MAAARWFPEPLWKGQPCYIVGGGPSLKDFPWETLCGSNVLGCNAAFYLGQAIVPIIIFGDAQFLHQHFSGLERYAADGGMVVTNSARLTRVPSPPPWIKVMKKVLRGLATDGLGWNGNTGASAINLALLMGADPIYLLGYDMRLSLAGEANFHNAYTTKSNLKTYNRFLRGMATVAHDLPQLFPGQRVINLEDGTSALGVFPRESLKMHLMDMVVPV